MIALCSAVLLFLFLCLPSRAAEGFSFSLSAQHGGAGDTIELSVSYDGSLGEVGAFSAQVSFDPQTVDYRSVRKSEPLRDAYTVVQAGDGFVSSVYVQKEESLCISQPGELFSYRFRLKDDLSVGEAQFHVAVEQIVSPDGRDLGSADGTLACTVDPAPSKEAFLLSLTPSAGVLSPDFSSDQFDYSLNVPFEVSSLSFSAEAAEGASWKVNRKNLGAGGSDTLFVLTVTAADGKTKTVYQVTAHREEKQKAAASPTPAQNPGTAATAKATVQPKPTAGSAKTPKPTQTPKPTKAPEVAKTPKPTAAPKAEQTETPTAPPTAPPLVYKTGNDFTFPLALLLTAVALGQAVAPAVSDFLREKRSKEKRSQKEKEDDEEIDDS